MRHATNVHYGNLTQELLLVRMGNASTDMGTSYANKNWIKAANVPHSWTFRARRVKPKGRLISHLDGEPDSSARQAVLLALCEDPISAFGATEREKLNRRLPVLARQDPDPGVHSAVDFLLRKNQQEDWIQQKERQLISRTPKEGRRCYVNGQGQTMAVIPASVEFDMGTAYYASDKRFNNRLHRRRIDRSFAIATKEITFGEFQQFLKMNPELKHPDHQKSETETDVPVSSVTWYEAVQYCRWLSREEGFSDDQMCYPPIDQIKEGMQLENTVNKTGYRLPTEAEWEYTCRAGTSTVFHFGSFASLIPKYSWFKSNSSDRLHPVGSLGPNVFGAIRHAHGNALEWCHNKGDRRRLSRFDRRSDQG